MSTTVVGVPGIQSRWNTLRVMRTMRWALVVLDFMLLLVVGQNAGNLRRSLEALENHAEPGIAAAYQLRSALAVMDADAAHELLQRPQNGRTSADRTDGRRIEIYRALLEAAERTSERGGTQATLASIAVELDAYERLLQQARDLQDRGTGATAVYERATWSMEHTLFAHAEDLEQASRQELNTTLKSEHRAAVSGQALLSIFGLLELALLVSAQMYLSRKTRRNLNLPLLTASLLAAVVGLQMWSSLAGARQQLGSAKDGTLASMQILWRARAAAYEAEANRNHSLLDPAHALSYRRSMSETSEQIALAPPDLNSEQLLSALREGRSVTGFSGLLADELQQVPAREAREAILSALSSWLSYESVTGQKVPIQEARLLGGERTSMDDLLLTFDKALHAASEAQQRSFDSHVEAGVYVLRGLEFEAVVIASMLAGLVYLGFAPRIREYC